MGQNYLSMVIHGFTCSIRHRQLQKSDVICSMATAPIAARTTEGPGGKEIPNPLFGVDKALETSVAEALAHARVRLFVEMPRAHCNEIWLQKYILAS
jgi:hypothetical protein